MVIEELIGKRIRLFASADIRESKTIKVGSVRFLDQMIGIIENIDGIGFIKILDESTNENYYINLIHVTSLKELPEENY